MKKLIALALITWAWHRLRANRGMGTYAIRDIEIGRRWRW